VSSVVGLSTTPYADFALRQARHVDLCSVQPVENDGESPSAFRVEVGFGPLGYPRTAKSTSAYVQMHTVYNSMKNAFVSRLLLQISPPLSPPWQVLILTLNSVHPRTGKYICYNKFLKERRFRDGASELMDIAWRNPETYTFVVAKGRLIILVGHREGEVIDTMLTMAAA
jgi:hypothetical protein